MEQMNNDSSARPYFWVDDEGREGRISGIRRHVQLWRLRQQSQQQIERERQHINVGNGLIPRSVRFPVTKCVQNTQYIKNQASPRRKAGAGRKPRRVETTGSSTAVVSNSSAARCTHATTMPRSMPPVLETDRLLRLLTRAQANWKDICIMKKATGQLLLPNAIALEQKAHENIAESLMSGCNELRSQNFGNAFRHFDRGFSDTQTAIDRVSLQSTSLVCSMLLLFPERAHQEVFLHYWDFVDEFVTVREQAPGHPVRQFAHNFIGREVPMNVLAEALLPCSMDVLEEQLGFAHPAFLSAASTTAGTWLQSGRYVDAEQGFLRLVTHWEHVSGPFSVQVCRALVGLAEAKLRLGALDTAEDMMDDVLGRRLRALGSSTAKIEEFELRSLKMECWKILASLAQKRNNVLRALWLLQEARDTAEAIFGVDNWRVSNIRREMIQLEANFGDKTIFQNV